MPETRTCAQCPQSYEITQSDKAFYEKMSQVPAPRLCPDCRMQRRQGQVNQINLFKRRCDATGEIIVTNHPPESPYKVFSQKFWYSDNFDATNFGMHFDFNRPFFEQFHELSKKVPRPALFTDYLRDENSDYTNYAGKNKNCYFIFDSDENWDCLYSYGTNSSKNSSDCYRVQKLELCYETVDSKNSYNCAWIENCENCSNSAFLKNCTGCRSCFFSSNLHQKENYIFNKLASKKECDAFRKSLASAATSAHYLKEFENYVLQFPQKFMHGFKNEDVTGDYLMHCKNAYFCFDSMNLWDGKYCAQMFMKTKDAVDCNECGDGQLLYECTNLGYNAYNLKFCSQSLNELHDLTYCNLCFYSNNCFGCIGLKRTQYCILNKQYTKEEYEKLVHRIIEQMKKNHEWGEFFPINTSAFPYNLSVAQEYFPLSKGEALARGFTWHDEDSQEFQPQKYEIPDSIDDVSAEIIQETLGCICCGRNYRITSQEFDLYKTLHVPVPRQCFFCRHARRRKARNSRKLFQRQCGECETVIQTTYGSQRKETVLCEKCYLNAIY